MFRTILEILLPLFAGVVYLIVAIVISIVVAGTPITYVVENHQSQRIEVVVDGRTLAWQEACSTDRYLTGYQAPGWSGRTLIVRNEELGVVQESVLKSARSDSAKIVVPGHCTSLHPVLTWWGLLGVLLFISGAAMFVESCLPIRRMPIARRATQMGIGFFCIMPGLILVANWLSLADVNELTTIACVPAMGIFIGGLVRFRMLEVLKRGRDAMLRFEEAINAPTYNRGNSGVSRWLSGRKLPGVVKRYYDID